MTSSSRIFNPFASRGSGERGLLTGYFEPIVAGSRFPSPEFPVPLYRRPGDLVAAGYKQGSLAFPNKGVIGRRNANNELVPYHDRGAIEAGALDGRKLEICWLKDPFDLLAIQLEGSGRVISRTARPCASVSIHAAVIALLYRAHCERAQSRFAPGDFAAAHPRVDGRASGRGREGARRQSLLCVLPGHRTVERRPTVGAQGVPLTPGRSIAVDRVHEYGTPFSSKPICRSKAGSGSRPSGA